MSREGSTVCRRNEYGICDLRIPALSLVGLVDYPARGGRLMVAVTFGPRSWSRSWPV